MEISIVRDNKKVFDFSSKDIMNKLNNKKFLMKCAVPLSLFKLDSLEKGQLVVAPGLKDLFSASFPGFGFSMGQFMMVAMIIMLVYTLAPKIGEFLSEREIPSWIYTIVCVTILIGWCFI